MPPVTKEEKFKKLYSLDKIEEDLNISIPYQDSFQLLEEVEKEYERRKKFDSLDEAYSEVSDLYEEILSEGSYILMNDHNDADGFSTTVLTKLLAEDSGSKAVLESIPPHEFGHWDSILYKRIDGASNAFVMMRDHRPQDMKIFSYVPKAIKDRKMKKLIIVDHHPNNPPIADYCLQKLDNRYKKSVNYINIARDIDGIELDEVPCSSEFHYRVCENLSKDYDLEMDAEEYGDANPYAIAVMHGIYCDHRGSGETAKRILNENPRLASKKSGTGRYPVFIQNNAIFNDIICAGWEEGAKIAEQCLHKISKKREVDLKSQIYKDTSAEPVFLSLEELNKKWDKRALSKIVRDGKSYTEIEDGGFAFVYLPGNTYLKTGGRYGKYLGRADKFYLHRQLTYQLRKSFRRKEKPVCLGVVSYKIKNMPQKWRIRGSARAQPTSAFHVGKACLDFNENLVKDYITKERKISELRKVVEEGGAPRGGGHETAGAFDVPYLMVETVVGGEERIRKYIENQFAKSLKESL